MNIKILDSWLKEFVKTDASVQQISEAVSLSSASIDRVEKWKDDFLYDVEITTNRVDMASVVGLAREAGAVLPQFHHKAKFTPPTFTPPKPGKGTAQLEILNNPKLVNRICAVVMDVTVKDSPNVIKNRLEATDIRSLNNLVDVTNYVMRTIGYPTHVMDYDRIGTGKLIIRESKKGEKITTLDGKTYELPGGDIVADDGTGRIVDLLGIMGLENSVVTATTKRIIFFINNDDPYKIRKTSMTLGIRTEAAQLNEKELDPELMMDALLYGIKLYGELGEGSVKGDIIDIYPNKPKQKKVAVTVEKVNAMLGITLPRDTGTGILERLGFDVRVDGSIIEAKVPSFRVHDINIPEDLVEEIARVYGYQNLPNVLPAINSFPATQVENEFYWEHRTKNALKYWGFTEVYTYPMVSETLYEGPLENSVKLKNPLGEEFAYMRGSLIPSLLKVIAENKKYEKINLFEIANVYEKDGKNLPRQKLRLAGVVKQKNVSFYEVKGVIEQLALDLGIKQLTFKPLSDSGIETEILIGKRIIGTLEMLDDSLIDFELDFDALVTRASTRKTFTPLQKYPPVIEDLSLIVDEAIPTGDIITVIKTVSPLIADVSLIDKYDSSRTFHIVYQSDKKNLTTEEVGKIREKVLKALKENHRAILKG
jgi:phenylalanyl-tRNA synthetase beta chain